LSPPAVEELHAHLVGELLPFWREHGVDPRGVFVSRLAPGPVPLLGEPRRLLVQARQLYTFSLGSLAGGPAWMEELGSRGVDVLLRDFWDEEHGGLFLTTSPDGAPADRAKDLYTHSFVLLAMAARDACGDARALPLAERTLALLEEHLADDESGGFVECGDADWTPRDEPRQQNPHMHLFEAALALAEQDGAGPWLPLAQRLLALFEERIVDAKRGVLRESFEAGWAVRGDDVGRVTEPGHHFEWVWLLYEYARVSGDESRLPLAERLFERGASVGVDAERGGVYDEVDVDGRVLRDSKRLWPQTEYLKALAVRGERAELSAALAECWRRYRDPGGGGWREHLAADGTPVSDRMNATSVYHVWAALTAAAGALAGS
jgi:mannose-6-phosphate isomerase